MLVLLNHCFAKFSTWLSHLVLLILAFDFVSRSQRGRNHLTLIIDLVRYIQIILTPCNPMSAWQEDTPPGTRHFTPIPDDGKFAGVIPFVLVVSSPVSLLRIMCGREIENETLMGAKDGLLHLAYDSCIGDET